MGAMPKMPFEKPWCRWCGYYIEPGEKCNCNARRIAREQRVYFNAVEKAAKKFFALVRKGKI